MNRNKSILFHYSIMNIGGAEKSVLRLMKLLSDKDWDVTLVLTTGGGNLEWQIDPRVNVYHLRSKAAGNKFKTAKGLHKLKYIGDLSLYLLFWLEGLFKSFSFLFRRYDAAAISLQGLSPKFVCHYVRVKKRFHWIRSDLSAYDADPSGKIAVNIHRYHSKIDQYICVSNTALASLNEKFPETLLKSSVLYNVIDAKKIRLNADENTNPLLQYDHVLKVVTVWTFV